MTNQRARFLITLVIGLLIANNVYAKGDDFNSVVKLVEQFYGVKHEGLPFLARTAMKVMGTGAKIRGGDMKRFAELGNVKVATFESQKFEGDFMKFKSALNDAMAESWTPLIQTISVVEQEQVYIFVRPAGEKFNVLLVTIESSEATVVQATVSGKDLVTLMKDPENVAKRVSQEATMIDQD